LRSAVDAADVLLLALIVIGTLSAASAAAISVSPFSALGTGGSSAGQTFSVGTDGDVFEFDTIVGTSS